MFAKWHVNHKANSFSERTIIIDIHDIFAYFATNASIKPSCATLIIIWSSNNNESTISQPKWSTDIYDEHAPIKSVVRWVPSLAWLKVGYHLGINAKSDLSWYCTLIA